MWRTKLLPMKPAPPVIRIVVTYLPSAPCGVPVGLFPPNLEHQQVPDAWSVIGRAGKMRSKKSADGVGLQQPMKVQPLGHQRSLHARTQLTEQPPVDRKNEA